MNDETAPQESRTLLVVDDDRAFADILARSMTSVGYEVEVRYAVPEALDLIDEAPPSFAIVDMRVGKGNGLDVIARLREANPSARVIMLTGYANLAGTVSAIKLGAVDVLAKPADIEDIQATLESRPGAKPAIADHFMSPDEARLAHIAAIYNTCNGNISETSRRLGMHRRTLQRILSRNPLPGMDEPVRKTA